MQSFRCSCNNVIFFDNSRCLACGSELGFCPACRNLTALVAEPSGGLRCGHDTCRAALVKCVNYAQHDVCNRCLNVESSGAGGLCDCCRFNETIPDLTIPGNLQKWYALEAAKRRLFYELDQLGLRFGQDGEVVDPPLRFDFKADVIPTGGYWRSIGDHEQVFTGHVDGRITINIREADDAAREKLRVELGEPQRTLIGHFRHEIGHYFWERLVKGRREDEFQELFGNPFEPSYEEGLEAHYQNGPPADWRLRFVSAYATMHPWEDFAETFSVYLDMVSALDTAEHVGVGGATATGRTDLDAMVVRYQALGLALNELNRGMGLLDLVPEVFVAPVVEKLRLIHHLVREDAAVANRFAGVLPPEANPPAGEPSEQSQPHE